MNENSMRNLVARLEAKFFNTSEEKKRIKQLKKDLEKIEKEKENLKIQFLKENKKTDMTHSSKTAYINILNNLKNDQYKKKQKLKKLKNLKSLMKKKIEKKFPIIEETQNLKKRSKNELKLISSKLNFEFYIKETLHHKKKEIKQNLKLFYKKIQIKFMLEPFHYSQEIKIKEENKKIYFKKISIFNTLLEYRKKYQNFKINQKIVINNKQQNKKDIEYKKNNLIQFLTQQKLQENNLEKELHLILKNDNFQKNEKKMDYFKEVKNFNLNAEKIIEELFFNLYNKNTLEFKFFLNLNNKTKKNSEINSESNFISNDKNKITFSSNKILPILESYHRRNPSISSKKECLKSFYTKSFNSIKNLSSKTIKNFSTLQKYSNKKKNCEKLSVLKSTAKVNKKNQNLPLLKSFDNAFLNNCKKSKNLISDKNKNENYDNKKNRKLSSFLTDLSFSEKIKIIIKFFMKTMKKNNIMLNKINFLQIEKKKKEQIILNQSSKKENVSQNNKNKDYSKIDNNFKIKEIKSLLMKTIFQFLKIKEFIANFIKRISSITNQIFEITQNLNLSFHFKNNQNKDFREFNNELLFFKYSFKNFENSFNFSTLLNNIKLLNIDINVMEKFFFLFENVIENFCKYFKLLKNNLEVKIELNLSNRELKRNKKSFINSSNLKLNKKKYSCSNQSKRFFKGSTLENNDFLDKKIETRTRMKSFYILKKKPVDSLIGLKYKNDFDKKKIIFEEIDNILNKDDKIINFVSKNSDIQIVQNQFLPKSINNLPELSEINKKASFIKKDINTQNIKKTTSKKRKLNEEKILESEYNNKKKSLKMQSLCINKLQKVDHTLNRRSKLLQIYNQKI